MKFSVLLPTRNRLELLRYAVESVRRQDYNDWEIVISDNSSEEDIAGYVASQKDCRIRYFRTESFVSVTANWNNALAQATGDYVIMLGDDDALMPGFFSSITDLANRFNIPDLIYIDAFVFGYPGVLPGHSKGVLRYGYNTRFACREPFVVSREKVLAIVREALTLQLPIFYNMQLSILRREFIESLCAKGEFFQSPFPDYYATVASLLSAQRVLVYQQPLVVIGVSKHSFGFYYFNSREKQGEDFLNNLEEQRQSRLRQFLMPGSTEWTCRLIAMDTVAQNYKELLDPHGIKVDYQAYRRAQIMFSFRGYYLGEFLSPEEFREAQKAMSAGEWLRCGVPLTLIMSVLRIPPKRMRQRLGRLVRRILRMVRPTQETQWRPTSFTDILDVYENVSPRLS